MPPIGSTHWRAARFGLDGLREPHEPEGEGVVAGERGRYVTSYRRPARAPATLCEHAGLTREAFGR
jgi:hypothetical protein